LHNAHNYIQDFPQGGGKLRALSDQVSAIKNTIKEMLESAAQEDLMKLYDSFYPGMIACLKQVPETSHFSAKVFKVKSIKRKYALKPLKSRQVLESILANSVQDDIIFEGKKLQQKILELTSDLEEILQVVEVSYDYYGPKGNDFPDKDRQELSSGVKRTIRKIEEFNRDLMEMVSNTFYQ